MKFVLVNAKERRAWIADMDDLQDAERAVGLSPGEVDHGSIAVDMAVVVYEYGLFIDPKEQHYFSVNKSLYAGNAVLYAVDHTGETVDAEVVPPIMFFKDAEAIELAIARGEVTRPRMAVNEKVVWQWPEKRTT